MNPQVTSQTSQHPLKNFQQHRPVEKGDRVNFFNDKTNTWTVATLTSGPNKYYRKQGPYPNFVDMKNSRGGHFFHPGGLWSILSDDINQLHHSSKSSDDETLSSSNPSRFIDDDYADQLQLSLSPQLPQHRVMYPSAASFPDMDLAIPSSPPRRDRSYLYSEPDLPTMDCRSSLQHRWNRLKTAVKAWSTTDILSLSTSEEEADGEGETEERRAATPT